MLEILDIDYTKFIPVTEITRYDRVIFPDKCFFMADNGNRMFTSEYVELIDKIRDFAIAHATPTGDKKLYFSYSYSRKTVGEDKLARYFESKGYKIISPEKHSFDEQLNMLANCESFAAPVGSCAHSSVFLRDNSEVILIPRSSYINEYQFALNHVHNLKVTYVDSSFSIFNRKEEWIGPFLFFVSSNLRKYFGDEDTQHIISFKDFKLYFDLAFGLGLHSKSFGIIDGGADNPNAYRYYSAIAAEYFSQINAMLSEKHKYRYKIRLVIRAIRDFLKRR